MIFHYLILVVTDGTYPAQPERTETPAEVKQPNNVLIGAGIAVVVAGLFLAFRSARW